MKSLLSLFLLIFFVSVSAQHLNYTFTNYTSIQGLPDNTINCITQDSRGFIWIGTTEGLSRYDGKKFKNFFAKKNDSILTPNAFSNIYEYKKNHLVMNNYGKVICFNTINEQFYFPKHKLEGFLSAAQTENGDKYFISSTNKSYICNKDLNIEDSVENFPNPEKNHLLLLYYFEKNELLVEYNNAFCFYNLNTKKYSPIILDTSFTDKTRGLNFRYYDAINHTLYFTEYFSGNYSYSLVSKKLTYLSKSKNAEKFPSTYTFKIIPKGQNELWILTAAGIEILNTKTGYMYLLNNDITKPTSLISNTVSNGFIDKDNNFWFATVNGLSKLNGNALGIKSWSKEFSTTETNGLMSIVEGADNNMYASVYFGKAYQVNTTTNKVVALQHELNNGNWNLFTKGDEIIKTGSGTKLLSYNTKTNQFNVLDFLNKFYPNSELIVLGFVHSSGDEWYSANRGGGFVRKLANGKGFKTYKMNDGVNTFTNSYYCNYVEDMNGDVWFGVNKSAFLLHWNHKTDKFEEIKWEKINKGENKIIEGINAITHDAQNNIWVGFAGSGIVKYNPQTKESIRYTIADGLPSSFIQGLQFDQANRLWITTFKGLSCFVISEGKFINFKCEDGIPEDNFTNNAIYFDDKKDLLWMGSNSTLMMVNPDELLKINKSIFPIYIDEIYINGNRYNQQMVNDLKLNSTDNNLYFQFVGVDVNKGKEIEYSYMMEGADKDWVNAGENQTASYANLKYGKYLFKVRARHKGDNKWNEIETALHIAIATPWYNTWLFIILLFVLIGMLIAYFIRNFYVRKLERHKAKLEKQHAIELERTRLARELHDGLGSMLSGIKHSFSSIQNNIALDQHQDKNFNDNIEKLNASIREIRNLSHSMMDSDSLLAHGLPNALKDYCRNISHPGSLDVTFKEIAKENIVLKEEQAFHILRIVQELLQNVIKHAFAKKALVQLSYDNNQLNITVEDDGIGFDVSGLGGKRGIGLNNIKERIKILNGEIDIKSEKLQGTSVFISCPL